MCNLYSTIRIDVTAQYTKCLLRMKIYSFFISSFLIAVAVEHVPRIKKRASEEGNLELIDQLID